MSNSRVCFPLGRFQTQSVRYISTSFENNTPKAVNFSIDQFLNPESPNKTSVAQKNLKVNPVRFALWKLVLEVQHLRHCINHCLSIEWKSTGSGLRQKRRKFMQGSAKLLKRLEHIQHLVRDNPFPGKPPSRWNETTFSYVLISMSLLANIKSSADAISFQSCRTTDPLHPTKQLSWTDIFCYLNVHNKILKLSLKRCSINSVLVRELCERFPELIELDLSINMVGDEGAEDIAKHLKRLRVLRLVDNGVGDRAGAIIGRNLKSLRELGLNNNFIGDQSGYQIASNLLHLRELYLGSNQLTDEAIIHLVANLTKLVRLWIRGNRLTKMGEKHVQALKGSKTDIIL